MDTFATSEKLKTIAMRNTRSTLVAYAVPSLLYSAVVSITGLTNTPYWIFVGMYLFSAAFILLNLTVIRLLPTFTYEIGAPILYAQLSFFLLVFFVWIGLLQHGRYGGLFFALSMLVYTYAYGTKLLAISLNTTIVGGYLGASYFVLSIQGTTSDFVKDLVAVSAFLPVSILLSKVGSKLAIKKRKVKALLAEQEQTQQHLQETLLKLELAAKTDELTGLLNRREINHRLEYEFNKIKRNHSLMSVLILDLDHFKEINDTHGHQCGDVVLKHTAELLLHAFRETDSVSRWGGEEFIVLMPETNLSEAQSVSQRALHLLAHSNIEFNDQVLTITASGGLCEINGDNDIEACLHQADEYLYEAKRLGRNQILSASSQKQVI